MSSSASLLAGGTTKTAAGTATTTTTRSLFALALRAWNLCVLLVATAALLLVSPAAVVILLPIACMAASAFLLCAIAARILLLPLFVPPPDRARDDDPPSHAVRELRKQDCVEVDRAEAPGGGVDDDASSAEEGHEQEHGLRFSSLDQERSDPCDDEQRRFYYVDTGSYCRTFYDLLALWRSMEREATGGVCKKCSSSIYEVERDTKLRSSGKAFSSKKLVSQWKRD